MAALTLRQSQMLDYIAEYKKVNSVSPSIRELMGAFGMHNRSIEWYLNSLERRGFLTREFRKARTIVLKSERIFGIGGLRP